VGHTGDVLCVAFSADGRWLASGSGDEMIRLWDVTREFAEISSATSESPVWSLSFSPNSDRLVSGSFYGALRFWNISSGILEQLGETIYGHDGHNTIRSGGVISVVFSPDGLFVASGSYDGSVKLWTVPTTFIRLPAAVHKITEKAPNEAGFLYRRGCPILSDGSYIDQDGWMRDSRGEDSRRLFWVPHVNRVGFWWPRNTAVIARTVTKIDFSRFAHGENWAECRSGVV